jgi:hypothetical protein
MSHSIRLATLLLQSLSFFKSCFIKTLLSYRHETYAQVCCSIDQLFPSAWHISAQLVTALLTKEEVTRAALNTRPLKEISSKKKAVKSVWNAPHTIHTEKPEAAAYLFALNSFPQ